MLRKMLSKYTAFMLSLLMVLSLISPIPTVGKDESHQNRDEQKSYVTASVEKFTLGQGYYIEPTKVSFNEGETVGNIIARVLGTGNYIDTFPAGEGTIGYLAKIKDNDPSPVKIPQYIIDAAGTIGTKNDPEWLGERDYNSMSGWMYLVNNEMAPVGMAAYKSEDGDVIRLQFSVHGFGSDLGFGFPPLIETANKDALTATVAELNSRSDKNEILSNSTVSSAYTNAYTVLKNMESSQTSVDEALAQLTNALELAEVDKTSLKSAITEAITNKESVSVSVNGTDIDPTEQWVTEEEKTAYETAIKEAQEVVDNAKVTQEKVDDAVTALASATETFDIVKKSGTKIETPTVNLKEIEMTIDETVDQIINTGVTTEWQAIGIAKAGKKVPSTYYEKHFLNNLKEQVIDASRKKITDVERLVLSAGALGLDAKDINGTNLIELIYNSEDWPNGNDSMTAQGNNGPIFALIALDSGSFAIPKDARWTREKLVNYILKQQFDDGSWPLSGSSLSYDITAMALIGLAPYSDQPEVKTAIDKAVAFLSKEQGSTGGYNEEFVGGISSETTSQVIIGLTAVGIDPTSSQFTKEDGNLLDHLLSFQTKDGSFEHVKGYGSDAMATEQALQALVAYQLFVKGEGPLYRFDNIVQQPEIPSKPEDPNEQVKPIEKIDDEEQQIKIEQVNKDKADSAVDENSGKGLPQTATQAYNVLVVGMLLLAIGLAIWMYQRRKHQFTK